MPQTVTIGLLVLGGVLLLVAITGGKFKLFVAEVDSPVTSGPVRIISGVLGVALIVVSLVLNHPSSSSQTVAGSNPSSSGASPAQASDSAATKPVRPSTETSTTRANPQTAGEGEDNQGSTSAANSDNGISSDLYAVVFDPPTNVRSAPATTSEPLCSVSTKKAIRILGTEGDWYRTDVCGGRIGYIYRNQVKF